jgi:hypothetical protein
VSEAKRGQDFAVGTATPSLSEGAWSFSADFDLRLVGSRNRWPIFKIGKPLALSWLFQAGDPFDGKATRFISFHRGCSGRR